MRMRMRMRLLILLGISASPVAAFLPKNIIGTALFEAPIAMGKGPNQAYAVVVPAGPPLFFFRPDGTEMQDLLPPLNRRLDAGIACYYEEMDRPVIWLIHKAKREISCTDACWALEACRGNVEEALIHVAVAKRLQEKGYTHTSDHANQLETLNLDSYESVPLELVFSRHVKKQNRRRKNRQKRKGGVLVQLAFFLTLCRYAFGGFSFAN
jgi:hypothetical protein